MRHAMIALIMTVLVTGYQAQARIVAFHLDDEIAGTRTYYVQIRASRYEEYTWEEQLLWICSPNGHVQVSWKQGGQFSGYNVGGRDGDREIDYKLDDHPPSTFTFGDLNQKPQSSLKSLYAGMLKAKRLVLRSDPLATTTSSFSLAGFSSSAGPNSRFGKQCADALLSPDQKQSN